jgi:exopolysaccharide production protein ExoZ
MVHDKLLNLQGLRGVACLLVVFLHIHSLELSNGTEFQLLSWTSSIGHSGVDLFFVLSGFIITWAHYDHLGKVRQVPKYFFRRLWRIYPTYWVCFTCTALFLQILPADGYYPGGHSQFLRFFFLVPQYKENFTIQPAWSLVWELCFYLSFSVFFFIPKRCFIPLLAIWFSAAFAHSIWAGDKVHVHSRMMLHPLILEFLLGCFVAILLRHQWILTPKLFLGLGICLLIGFVLFIDRKITTPQTLFERAMLFGIPAAMMVYGGTSMEMRQGIRFPKVLQSIGDASYSIYLTHFPAFWLLARLQLDGNYGLGLHIAWLVWTFAAVLIMGYTVHFLIEKPLLKWGQRRFQKKPVLKEANGRNPIFWGPFKTQGHRLLGASISVRLISPENLVTLGANPEKEMLRKAA